MQKEIYNRAISIIVILLLTLLIPLDCFAGSKTSSDSQLFNASVPNKGIYVNWRVNFLITADYNNASVPYVLKKIHTTAYIDPKRDSTVGNGAINGSVSESLDHGNTVTRNLSSSFWSHSTGIWSTTAYVYFNKEGTVNKSFSSQASETGNYYFYYPDGVVYNPNYSLNLKVTTRD